MDGIALLAAEHVVKSSADYRENNSQVNKVNREQLSKYSVGMPSSAKLVISEIAPS